MVLTFTFASLLSLERCARNESASENARSTTSGIFTLRVGRREEGAELVAFWIGTVY